MTNFFKSFQYANRGIRMAIKSERNMKVHFVIGAIVLLLGIFLNISATDFTILIILIGIVISAEMVNTAIEQICDIFRDKYKLAYEGSRNIRDIAAGVVWILAITAAISGLIILGKYIV